MPFPKKAPGSAPAVKKSPKFTKAGTLVGCERVVGPERVEINGHQMLVEVQVSRRSKSALVRLATAAMARPDGVKSIQGGLFRVIVRPDQKTD